MPFNLQMMLQPFEKWVIDFVGPIQPQGKTGARYIITAMEYLNHWVEAQPVKDCTGMTATKFLFKHVLTSFNCPKILISDCGTHFLNEMINALIEEFQVFNAQRSDWDLCIPAVLRAYRTTCNKLIGQTPFRLVYGVEAVMPMEYIVPSLCIAALIGMTDHRALVERLTQLDELEEERFIVGFHQEVQKQHEKAWHDWYIKLRTFKLNDLVLLYDSKFDKFRRKFRMY
eukprot:PITA_14956